MKRLHFIEMNKYVKVDIQSLLISSNKWITNGADNSYFYAVEDAYLGSQPTSNHWQFHWLYISRWFDWWEWFSWYRKDFRWGRFKKCCYRFLRCKGACAFQVIYNFGGPG